MDKEEKIINYLRKKFRKSTDPTENNHSKVPLAYFNFKATSNENRVTTANKKAVRLLK